jgi:hypothetical protein
VKTQNPLLSDDFYLVTEISDWANYLNQMQDVNSLNRIRINTHSGLPCGTDDFIQTIENKLNRKLKAMPSWRPKKSND